MNKENLAIAFTAAMAFCLMVGGLLGIIWYGNPEWNIVTVSMKLFFTGMMLIVIVVLAKSLREEVVVNE